jgi:hypothetical protein
MPRRHRRDTPAGLGHLALALVILGGLGLYGLFPDAMARATGTESGPRIVLTEGGKSARCAANTVDTILGTLGCGGIKKATRLERITFTSASRG